MDYASHPGTRKTSNVFDERAKPLGERRTKVTDSEEVYTVPEIIDHASISGDKQGADYVKKLVQRAIT
jgi:hypothetical protein